MKGLLLGLVTAALGFAQLQPLNVMPTNGQTAVPLNARILVSFGPFGPQPDSIRLSLAGRPITGRQEQRDRWLVFTPSQSLAPRTTYELNINIANNQPYSGRFTTGDDLDNTSPTILSDRPGERRDGSGTNLEIRFSKPMNPIALLASTRSGVFPNGNSIPNQLELSRDATTLTILGSSDVFNRIYSVNFSENPAAFDWTGNRLPALPTDLLISTYPSAPRASPLLVQSIPAPGETGVPTNSSILLEFSANIAGDEITLARLIELRDQDGQLVPFRLEASDFFLTQRYLIIRPSQLLRGNRGYRLQVSGLRDEFSNAQTTPITLDFQTASLPELQSFRILSRPEFNSQPSLPGNTQFRWTFSRPVGIVLTTANTQGPALKFQFSDDRRSMSATVPAAGTYSGQLQILDRVELRREQLNYNLNVSAEPDNTPPALLYTLPAASADQTVSFPSNGRLRAVFSETVSFLEAPILLRDGAAQPINFTNSNNSVEIAPRSRLEDGAQYIFRVPAVQDVAGNILAAREIAFQASAALLGTPVLLSTTPGPLANDVDRNQPLVFEFDRPVDPASIDSIGLNLGLISFVDSRGPTDRWAFNGNRITFTPNPRWPRSSIVNWQVGSVRDWAGNTATSRIASRFATRDDEFEAVPLRIVSTSIPNGTVVPANGETEIEIRFRVSTAVNAATLNSSTVQVFDGDAPTSFLRLLQYDAASSAIVVRLVAFSGRRYSIRFTAAISGLEDQPLEPLLFTFSRSAPGISNAAPPGITFTEPNRDERLEAGAPVVLYFSPGTGRARVEQGLSIRVGRLGRPSQPASFDLEWAPDESAVTLRPRSPLQGGDQLTVLLSMLPWGINQVFPYNFNVQPVIPTFSGTPWPVLRVSADFAGIPLDAAFDIEFSRDIPDAVLASATAFFWDGSYEQPRPVGELRVTRLSARVLRLRPASVPSPPLPANYIVRFGAEIVARGFARYATLPLRPSVNPAFTLPVHSANDVPVNIDPKIVFPVSVSRLTGTIALETGGIRLPLTVQWNETAKIATLRRQGLLRANTLYSLVVENMQDITGRPLPAQRIDFSTGGRTESRRTPRLQMWEPSGMTISRNADIRLYFDLPFVYEGMADGVYDWFAVANTGKFGGWIEYLDGGRLLRFVPDGPLPERASFGLPVRDNEPTPVILTTAADLSDPPTELTLVTPYRDATGVPAEAQIQLRFSVPVLQTSLSGIEVLANGERLSATTELAGDGSTVTLRPNGLLPADSLIEVRVSGVANTARVPIETALGWSFRTGPILPQPSAFAANWNSQARAIEFSVPVNPLTVRSNSCSLFERNGPPLAVSTEISADGLQMRCVPAVPLRPEFWYRISLDNSITSWTGQRLVNTNFELPQEISQVPADRQAPRLISQIPRQGTELSPQNSLLLTFDEPVRLNSGQVQISLNGKDLNVRTAPGTDTFALTHALSPFSGWLPNRLYNVRVGKTTDSAGNQSDPVDLQVLTGPLTANQPEALQLLRSTPANNSVGVELDTAVLFELDRPVAPTWDRQAYSISALANSNFNPPVEFGLNGNSLSLRPATGWPAGSNLFVRTTVRDQFGFVSTLSVGFTTAAPTDRTPPQVLQIYPASTDRLPSGSTRFVVRFSEAVIFTQSPVEMTAPGISSISVGQVLTPATGDGTVLTWEASLPAGSSVTLRLSGITDLSGNPLPVQNFTYFTLSPDEDTSSPRLLSVSPQAPQGLTGANPITLRFSQPMDQNSLRLALAIYRGNQVLDFSLASTDSGRTWTLTPPTPWPTGSGDLRLLLASTAFSQAGLLLTNATERYFFVVATATPNSSVEGSAPPSLAAYFATDRVIDLLFDRPLAEPPAEPFGVRVGHLRVPGVIRRMSERWLQILPDEPMREDASYHLMLGPALEIPFKLSPQPEQYLPEGAKLWHLEQANHRFALASLTCPTSPELFVPPQSRLASSLTILDPMTESQLECVLRVATSPVVGNKIRLKQTTGQR